MRFGQNSQRNPMKTSGLTAPALLVDKAPQTTVSTVHLARPMPTLAPYQSEFRSRSFTTNAPTTRRPFYTTRRPATTTTTRSPPITTTTAQSEQTRPIYNQIVRPPALTTTPSTYRQQWHNYNRQRYQTQNNQQQRNQQQSDCPIDGDECKLPQCFCSRTGEDIPGGLDVDETPQMVLISYDGPVTDRVINMLKALFDGRYRNANRCPIRATLFATHIYNNYDQVQWLMNNGLEIALGSMSNTNMSQQHQRRWYEELNGMRAAVERFSYANRSAIVGVRAPMFTVAGDEQMSTMTHLGLQYDSSIQVKSGPFWPQSLNYRPPWECGRQQRCPQRPHQSLWEFPVNEFVYKDKFYAHLSDVTNEYTTSNELYDVLLENYNRHVESSRTPFHLAINTDFLISIPESGVINSVQRFLQTILQNDYTYVVSIGQALEWIKRPTRLEKIRNFSEWNCRSRLQNIQPCENPSVCTFMNTAAEAKVTPHSFRVCGSCPNRYPWLNDPVGSGHNLYN